MAKYDEWITEEGLLRIEGWAFDGLSEKQIAEEKMGVAYSTFREWKKRFPALLAALKKSKEIPDRKVENALYKNALGYEYDEVTRELDESGQLVITKIVTKQVKPDTTAQIFYLKNRKPAEWRDKQSIEHSGETTQNIKTDSDLSKLSVKELKELESLISKTAETD